MTTEVFEWPSPIARSSPEPGTGSASGPSTGWKSIVETSLRAVAGVAHEVDSAPASSGSASAS